MKKEIIFIVTFLILTRFSGSLFAQDIHFSQFYASPISLNPGETGFFEGNWRLANNFRTQWSAIGEPFNTIAFSADKPFHMKKGKVGLGLLFVNDQSGSSHLNINKVYLSINLIKTYGDKHTFGFGIQPGYVVKSFSLNNITLPSQFNETSGLFDSSLPNMLDLWNENINYGDINLGITYSRKLEKSVPTVGVSFFHVNMPKVSFLREDNILPIRYIIHANLLTELGESFYSKVHFLNMYHKAAGNLNFGGSIHYRLPQGNMLEQMFTGVQTRTSINNFDAIIFLVGLNFYDFEIGLSYDINISPLVQASNMRGAFEISIIYKDISKSLQKIALPCDRF